MLKMKVAQSKFLSRGPFLMQMLPITLLSMLAVQNKMVTPVRSRSSWFLQNSWNEINAHMIIWSSILILNQTFERQGGSLYAWQWNAVVTKVMDIYAMDYAKEKMLDCWYEVVGGLIMGQGTSAHSLVFRIERCILEFQITWFYGDVAGFDFFSLISDYIFNTYSLVKPIWYL